jgi:hypothetical protein
MTIDELDEDMTAHSAGEHPRDPVRFMQSHVDRPHAFELGRFGSTSGRRRVDA